MKLTLTLILVLVCSAAYSGVWTPSSEWTPESEVRYSKWISTQFTKNFFLENPRWKGIPTDCADAVYTSRIIFSFENRLPFSIKDPTGSANDLTNQMSRWDQIQNPAGRVREFIKFINNLTDTKTLPNDTYPIAINRKTLIPGIVWLRTGHTETVTSVDSNGTIHLIGSTVPAKVRSLEAATTLFLAPASTDRGFRRWILPQNKKLAETQQPGFSLEQFSFNTTSGATFEEDVMSRLALQAETKPELVNRMATELCNLEISRIEIVSDGIQYSKKINRCMNGAEFEAFSTPSRDERILDAAKRLIEAASTYYPNKNPDSIVDSTQLLNACNPLKVSETLNLSMQSYVKSVLDKKVSSNPNDSIGARWGLAPSTTTCKFIGYLNLKGYLE